MCAHAFENFTRAVMATLAKRDVDKRNFNIGKFRSFQHLAPDTIAERIQPKVMKLHAVDVLRG